MRIAVSVAHAPWPPHLSGYGPEPYHQEHFFSYDVAYDLKKAIEADICGVTVDVIELPDHYDCFGSCTSGAKGSAARKKKKRCAEYKAGHRNTNLVTAGYDLALEFHLDYWHHRLNTPMGPMCMISGNRSNWTARAWSDAFLSKMETHRNQARRWKRQYNGIIDVDNDAGYSAYGFLKDGCENAVIIEAAVVNHAADIAWLDSDQAIPQLVDAATNAIYVVCG